MVHKPIQVLLVEDDLADVELMREILFEAFRETKEEMEAEFAVSIVWDGVEAMTYLRQEPPHESAALPNLILLDLNMPKKSGRDVLAEIKADPKLNKIPVVVLTTSNARSDIEQSYANGANCFISKPTGLDDLFRVIKSIVEFWFKIVKLPLTSR
jgi:chemotaxis family two-component system response regulator Rcp1